MQQKLVELQHDDSVRDVYSEKKFVFLFFHEKLIQTDCSVCYSSIVAISINMTL